MPEDKRSLPDAQDDPTEGSRKIATRRSLLQTVGVTLGAGAWLSQSAAAASSHELTIRSTDRPVESGGLNVTYRLTTSGEMTMVRDNGMDAAEKNDDLAENDDGTWTVEGVTGNGFGDTYRFDGEVVEFTADGSYELELDGSTVSRDELTESEDVQFSLASLTDHFTYYAVEVAAQSAPEPVLDDSDVENRLHAEPDDPVTRLDDGRYRIEGKTGTVGGEPPAAGDTFRWVPADDSTGIVDFSYRNADESEVTITLDGSKVSPEELTDSEDVQFSLASLTEHFTYYAVEVAAQSAPEPVLDDSDVENRLHAEPDESVTDLGDGRYRIEGKTGTVGGEPPAAGDTFRWTATADTWGILGFSVTDATESDLTITVNGTSVTSADLPGDPATGDNPDDTDDGSDDTDEGTGGRSGSEIGGGDGYSDTVPQSEATHVVRSRNELFDALPSASSGDVVYVPGGTTIDAGRGDFHVPGGVTLASDRGIDGSPGGMIEFSTHLWPQSTVGSDARITGIRVFGMNMEYEDHTRPRNIGMKTNGSGVEIDNCEFAGFRGAAIQAGADTHVHHCSIHDNQMNGLGYGVSCNGGNPTVEYCHFDRNRHSIMASGSGGYTFRYNDVGGTAWGIPLDIHSPGGTDYEIHHNTVRAETWPSNHTSRDYDGTEPLSALQIRGSPDSCRIYNNWFYNPNEPARSASGYGSDAIVKADPEDWGSVTRSDNHYGTSEPDGSIGHPR